MRRSIIWTILVLLGAVSCSKQSEQQASNDSTAGARAQKDPCTGALTTTPISDQVALDYLQRGLNEWPILRLAKDNGYYGVFPVDHFNLKPNGKSGVLLWFCIDPQTDSLFLALEQLDQWYKEGDVLPTHVLGKSVIVSFPYKLKSAAHLIGTHFSFERTIPPSTHNWVSTDIAYINRCIDNFTRQYGGQGSIIPYSNYPFSYFDEDEKPDITGNSHITDLHDLVKQYNGKFVRYYIGYKEKLTLTDGTEMEMPNKLRVVLIGLDCEGKRIQIKDGLSSLEDSWPPPPPFNIY